MNKTPASWISGLETKQAERGGHNKSCDRPRLGRYPKPLREALIERINTLERQLRLNGINVSWGEALDEFRNNVHMGITNPLYVMKYRGCGDIIVAARLLDEAFAKLRDYRPEDYLTDGVLSAAARFNRKGKTDADTPTAEDELRKMGIVDAPKGGQHTPGAQGWIREQVRLKTGLSERTINGLAAKLRKEAKLQKGIAMG
jgi:hypothetical protein